MEKMKKMTPNEPKSIKARIIATGEIIEVERTAVYGIRNAEPYRKRLDGKGYIWEEELDFDFDTEDKKTITLAKLREILTSHTDRLGTIYSTVDSIIDTIKQEL